MTDSPEPDEKDVDISGKLGYNRFMLDDVWVIGTDRMVKDDIKATRIHARECAERKRTISKSIAAITQNKRTLI